MPQIEIIYQDNNLLIVNKLAGQIVNAATSHQQESLQEYFAKIWQLLPLPVKRQVMKSCLSAAPAWCIG